MPHYVVLEHDHPVLHWDLMLESGESLQTWRLAAPPEPRTGTICAEQLPDHRLAYLDYEGPVSGGRGNVVRWDRGTFEWVQAEDQRVAVRVQGGRLSGILLLEERDTAWRVTVRPDGEAGQSVAAG